LQPTPAEAGMLRRTGQIAAVGDAALDTGAVRAGSSAAGAVAPAAAARAAAGAAKGAAVDALDQAGVTVSKRDIVDRLMDASDEAKNRLATGLAGKFQGVANEIVNHTVGDDVPLSLADSWKQTLQEQVNYAAKNNTPLAEGTKESAQILREAIDDAVKTTAPAPLAADYFGAKKAFGPIATVSDLATRAADRQATQPFLAKASPFALSAVVGGALTGGNPVGALGTALAVQAVRRRGVQTAAWLARSASDKIADLARTTPAVLGRYGPVLAGILATKGREAFNAHVFAAQQTDPAFNDVMQKAAGSD
jgi:hypothetical protein